VAKTCNESTPLRTAEFMKNPKNAKSNRVCESYGEKKYYSELSAQKLRSLATILQLYNGSARTISSPKLKSTITLCTFITSKSSTYHSRIFFCNFSPTPASHNHRASAKTEIRTTIPMFTCVGLKFGTKIMHRKPGAGGTSKAVTSSFSP